MFFSSNAFVAYVAKMFVANFALYVVAFTFFHIYCLALIVGAKSWKFYVYPFNILVRLQDNLLGYRMRKKSSFITPVIRFIFVMLLSFRCCSTRPTEISEALSTLNLTTSDWILADWHSTLWIWTGIGAVLKEQQIQFFLRKFVLFFYGDYGFIVFKFFEHIKSVNQTSFEWMNSVFTVKAKMEITECAFTWILFLFNDCQLFTSC